jgi:hypothetical protein
VIFINKKMAKAKKEGKKKRSRKSVLKTLKLIENNERLIKLYKENNAK